ncbi:hypothetical protein OHA72_46305 [Dactylosporangium sp. NBC_01737]|uniref:hypothetical protein n=1 Tax=Dactylosporangium sp. NBC_01737 TaxID=2975959 RepID=UPI002E136F91|nr:hypothetical protein OHA72_46305 [Dactylosporangium sp. NBC_01737]
MYEITGSDKTSVLPPAGLRQVMPAAVSSSGTPRRLGTVTMTASSVISTMTPAMNQTNAVVMADDAGSLLLNRRTCATTVVMKAQKVRIHSTVAPDDRSRPMPNPVSVSTNRAGRARRAAVLSAHKL